MITMEMTENLTGVRIRADFEDFYNLVDAFYEITLPEDDEKHRRYHDMSTRVLGLCYDVRHAYQGDRSVAIQTNHMNKEKMKWHGVITPEKNVYYEFCYILPEMIFDLIAIDELIGLRAKPLSKNSYFPMSEKSVIWNKSISVLRMFQSAFVQCIRESYSSRKFAMWFNLVSKWASVIGIPHVYIDLVNIDYLKLTKKARVKKLNTFTKRIVEYHNDPDYREISDEFRRFEKEYEHTDFTLNVDYPEDIIW